MKFLTNRLIVACFAMAVITLGADKAFAREVVLKSGTLVPVKTNERISSKSMRAGQNLLLSVERAIKVDGVTVIEGGTDVFATVSDRKGAGRAGISGHLTVQIDYTKAVDGTNVPLKGSFNTKGDSEIGGTVAAGVILCPLVFMNKGKEGVIPAGAVVRTLTISDQTIKVSDK